MAFPAIAALAAGGAAAATTAVVLGAVAEVGLVMSVVGAVTGNAKLMKVGGVLSLVGGVGGMLAKAGTTAATAAGTEAAAAGASEVAGVEALGEAGGYGFTSAETGLQQLGEAGFSGGEVLNFDEMLSDASSSLEVPEPGALKEMGAGPETLKMPEAPTPEALTPKSELISQPTSPVENTAQRSFYDAGTQEPVSEFSKGLPPAGSKDYFKTFMEWIKENKDAVKLIGEGAQGLANGPMNAAKKDYYKQATAESKSRYGHGNEVAKFAPRPLIGAA